MIQSKIPSLLTGVVLGAGGGGGITALAGCGGAGGATGAGGGGAGGPFEATAWITFVGGARGFVCGRGACVNVEM